MAVVELIASRRLEYNYARGAKATWFGSVKANNSDPDAALRTTIQSLGAEFAFCHMFNCYPDINWLVWRDEDLVTVHDVRVDVKYSPERTDGTRQALIVRKKAWKTKPPDYFALVIGSYPSYKSLGVMASWLLLVPERIAQWLDEPAYLAWEEELYFLRGPKDLHQLMTRKEILCLK